MAPAGPAKTPLPPLKPNHNPGVSWAKVVSSGAKPEPFEIPPHLQKKHFDKLKLHSTSAVTISNDLWLQARDSMQTSIYAKFLGKSLSLEQAKLAMEDAWRGLGNFSVADLPNGFYFIRCET